MGSMGCYIVASIAPNKINYNILLLLATAEEFRQEDSANSFGNG